MLKLENFKNNVVENLEEIKGGDRIIPLLDGSGRTMLIPDEGCEGPSAPDMIVGRERPKTAYSLSN